MLCLVVVVPWFVGDPPTKLARESDLILAGQ